MAFNETAFACSKGALRSALRNAIKDRNLQAAPRVLDAISSSVRDLPVSLESILMFCSKLL